MKKKPGLKELFATAVQGSRFLRAFIRHSEKIEGFSYMTGNLILMAKDSLAAGTPEFTLNMAAGALFLCSDASFAASSRWPWTRRISGACIFTAASMVMYAGMGKPEALAGHIMGTGMIALSGVQIFMENNMREWSAALAAKPRTGLAGIFAKAAEKYTAYPLLVAAAPNFLQKPILVTSALMRGDIPFAFTNLFWMTGDTGMAATDKVFKDMVKKQEPITESPQPAPVN